MTPPRDPVKRIEVALELGFSLPETLSTLLGRSIAAFARERGHRESEVSMCLRGYPGRVYAAIREDLAEELGLGRRQMDRLIEKGRRAAEGAAEPPEGPQLSGRMDG